MEKEQYDLMFAQEERHWWYVGMRHISTALLERYPPLVEQESRRQFDILDAGCGSGGMTRYLGNFGRVTGIDFASEALTLSKQRGLPRLARASVGAIPFLDGSFDVVTSFDVLYHLNVNDDRAALSEIHRVLRPGGIALIRLPAFDWIRGAHDEVVHTRHRYTRDELSEKLEDVGFRLEHSTYANFMLFPMAPAKRYLERRQGSHEATDLWRPPGPINRLLADLLSLEAIPARGLGLPWGLSVFAIGRRVQPLAVAPAPEPALAGSGGMATR
jgi:SAM-dependent methyltransferase